jgi:hypothetical protein
MTDTHGSVKDEAAIPPQADNAGADEAISSLNIDEDGNKDRSYNFFDSGVYDPVSTRFYLLLQILHAEIPVNLDEQTIEDVLTTTLAHHQQRLPDHLLLFKIGSVTYRETKRIINPTKKNSKEKRAHLFQLVLIPAPSEDQFDVEVFHDQCLTFALQRWHHHCNFQFSADNALCTPAHPSPPSRNPWAIQMNLLLPACNSSSDSARGCLLGILPDFFGCS